MIDMAILEALQVLAHERSDAVPYFTAHTLPASGNPTDPNAGTLGDGLAIPVPSWAVNAMVYVELADGPSSSGGGCGALVYVGPAVGAPLVSFGAVGSGSITTEGAAIPVLGIAGVGVLGVQFNENGDTAHPSLATVNVVFYR